MFFSSVSVGVLFSQIREEIRAAIERRYRVPVICVLVMATVAAAAFLYVRYIRRR